MINGILNKEEFTKEDIVYLLSLTDEKDIAALNKKALETKEEYVGRTVYYRGLIEYSNVCRKNCYYCGIRHDHKGLTRYRMTHREVVDAALAAYQYQYGSIVIQAGERMDSEFIDQINSLLMEIKEKTEGKLGITLSVGEQTAETYKAFFQNGAHRFLLRIETTNPELYKKLHPADHYFDERLKCLEQLQQAGYQTGTGIMIGLPFQTMEDLADDLLFFKKIQIDMVGMGPYIEHEKTPLYEYREQLASREERFQLALRMVAVLRIMMKDINIAAVTALQAIDPIGREKALQVGANVIMPNLTPTKYRADYTLYEDKPCLDEDAKQCRSCLDARIRRAGDEIGYGKWGDSKHFFRRTGK
ncbi:MAG: [FeFe] hydrogenase H-cluster radical SAM maturase HydE [bacterium]|nr:[FeFe] hydrogenase H-cluster radical SAM maturase HydE [bacterium]